MIKAKLLTRYPAAVDATAPIVSEFSNGVLDLSYDSSSLPQVSAPTGSGKVVVREGAIYNEVPALNIAFPTIANNTLVGNNSGGTAAPSALTAAQAAALLPAVVGDTGSGGTKGLVPAPAAGDAAAGRFLKADGTFAVPPNAVTSVAGRTGAVTLDGTDVAFTAAGSGAVTRNVMLKGRERISAEDYGAVGDGVTNDKAAIELALAAVGTTGGVVYLNPLKLYYVTSLVIPDNVSIDGEFVLPDNPGGTNATITYGLLGGIALNSSGTITMRANSGIRNIFIKRSGMTFPVASEAGFAGTAITFTEDSPVVMNVMVVGFNIGIGCSGTAVSRYTIDGFNCDAINGIYINLPSYDSSRIVNVHIWDFASANLLTQAALTRSGYGIYLTGSQDDLYIDNVLVWGHLYGVYLTATGSIGMGKVWIDYPSSFAAGSGSICLNIGANVTGVCISQLWCWGAEYGIISQANVGETLKIGIAHIERIASHAITSTGGDIEIALLEAKDITGYVFNLTNASSYIYARGTAKNITPSSLVSAPASGSSSKLDIKLNWDGTAGFAVFGVNVIDPPVIASASTVALPVNEETIIISGTTTINTLSGVWGGRVIKLIFQGACNLSAAGNIAVAFTGSANVGVTLVYSTTQGKWIAV
jgi:hypothetical protein